MLEDFKATIYKVLLKAALCELLLYRNMYTYIASVQIAVDRANDGSERDEQCTPDPRF